MNSHSTQYHPHEYLMPRDEYRELLRRSVRGRDSHHSLKCDSYDNERGWKNYDWLEHRTERDLTTVVWAIALVGALAAVIGCAMSYQAAAIGVVTNALR